MKETQQPKAQPPATSIHGKDSGNPFQLLQHKNTVANPFQLLAKHNTLQPKKNPMQLLAGSQVNVNTSTQNTTTPVKQFKPAPGNTQNNAAVVQLTRLSTVTKADYKARLAEILELGKQIGDASAHGIVRMATLTDEAFKRYQEDESGHDIPTDETVAVKIVSSNIKMKGDVPMEVHARDEIEAKNQEAAEEMAMPTITPDTYEVITVTDPKKKSAVVEYVIIMRLEAEGSMASKEIRKIGDYSPEFDTKMKKYANELKAALTVVKDAGYNPGDMKAENTLITDVDGDPMRAILADFGSYGKAPYNSMMDDITFVMNSIFSSKEKLPKKDKAAVTTWMSNDQLWQPD